MQRNFGGQSMVAPLKRVMVMSPRHVASPTAWQDFSYVHPCDDALGAQEHAAFVTLLRGLGVEVIVEDLGTGDLQDGIFTYDPSFVCDHGAIVLRMGKTLRLPESDLHENVYKRLGIPTVGRIVAPGQVEGGDCLWLDAQTLLVGRGYRTNTAGIAQLRGILEPLGVNVIAFDLPHHHGRTECMHLMSLISPLDHNLAAVYLPLMPAAMVELLEERSIGMVEIPEQEFDSMGINILTVRPKVCVMIAGNTESIARVRAAGCEIHEFAGQEISLNRGGGPTCLTRPIWRDA